MTPQDKERRAEQLFQRKLRRVFGNKLPPEKVRADLWTWYRGGFMAGADTVITAVAHAEVALAKMRKAGELG